MAQPSAGLDERQQRAVAAVDEMTNRLSEFHLEIWGYAEPVWREYRSASAYVDLLRAEGFDVEEGSGGMPTAFCATWGEAGPTVGLYAEYDATPGCSQAAVPYREPRPGHHRWAPGFNDAHCALGVGALAGALALKHTLERSGGEGRIKFFGEPAEKVCGSKPVHALRGYYDDLDFAMAYHPLAENFAMGEVQNGLYWSVVFTFECPENEPWIDPSAYGAAASGNAHTSVRSPGALHAVSLMNTAVQHSTPQMYPRTGSWSLNEALLGAGTATADNLAPRIAQIQYSWRSPSLDTQEQVLAVLKRNAVHVAGLTNCTVAMRWVSRIRPGLKNMTLARATLPHIARHCPPTLSEQAYEFGRQLERSLGHEPSSDPFLPEYYKLRTLEEADAAKRRLMPPWQDCLGSDDYTEYTWHTPTVRFYTAKPFLTVLGHQAHSHWANNAMNGFAPTIDPTWITAGKVIATTALEVMENPRLLAAAREEFLRNRDDAPERYQRSLLPDDFTAPIELPWPEYHETARGHEWTLPTSTDVGEVLVP